MTASKLHRYRIRGIQKKQTFHKMQTKLKCYPSIFSQGQWQGHSTPWKGQPIHNMLALIESESKKSTYKNLPLSHPEQPPRKVAAIPKKKKRNLLSIQIITMTWITKKKKITPAEPKHMNQFKHLISLTYNIFVQFNTGRLKAY